MKRLLISLFIIPVLALFSTWTLFKPIRVLYPSFVDGISCPSPTICLENISQHQAALALQQTAVKQISASIGDFQDTPRVIFCETQSCFQAFGFDKAAASTVGDLAIVIGPRGWKPHYLRHEMIHYRQAEELGMLRLILKPEWFIEGMAYALSNDPRDQLSDPWEAHRKRFTDWHQKLGDKDLWQQAGNL